MKKFTLMLGLALTSISINAQTHDHTHAAPTNPHFCGSSIEQNRLFAENPAFAIQDSIDQAQFQIDYENYLDSWSPDDRSLYVIPVVVHVVHLGGSENISDEQIFNALEKLNEDYNNENSDLVATIPEFAGIIGLANIEFRLATKDPSGNCHPGITRTYSSTTYDTGMSGSSHPIVDAVEDAQGNWPQNKYMNIFVCIDPNGAAGYTYRPANWYPAGRMYGSIFMRHDYMGTIGTSSSTARHTLAHEAGHWLNLAHPWGNSNSPGSPANCGTDDGVADTPNTEGWDNCSDVYGETCGSLDNVQNIMDYSYCSTMFTEGQAARMQTALLATTAQRYKLSTPANLAATGTDGPGALCEARFSSNYQSICSGSTIDFTDESFHSVTGWSWSFEGGAPSSSAISNPSITYNTPGIYSVTLVASNGGTSETITKENYILVLPNTGRTIPYSEGFESLTEFPDNNKFTVENLADDVTWELNTTTAYTGSKCVSIDNFGVNGGTKDAIVSETIDLSGVDPDDAIVFNFKYAYKRRNAGNEEWLRFYISKDCGETWALRKNINGDDLGPTISGSPYTPASESDWYQVNITNIYADYFVSNFRYKIEFEGDNGNNIYIDDINLYAASTADVNEIAFGESITVYPNPMANESTISLTAPTTEAYSITLFNTLGEQLKTIYFGDLQSGEHSIKWDASDLAKGIYILRIESQGQIQTIKVIKE
jgi:PKD repeat protein